MLRNTALRTCTVAVFFLWAALANRSIFAANDASASAHRDWTTVGGGNGNERYSSLSQINVGNVARLKGVWVRELGSKTRTPPVVVNGVIYTNDAARIYALNAKTGASIWEYAPKKSTPARGGVAVAEGKVFCGLLDGHVVALDLQNGKLVWTGYIGNAPEGEKADAPKINLAPDTPSFDPKVGLITAAPTYADGKIILGLSGGDGGTRSKVAALDAATGKVLWQWWVAPAAGEPGSETWPADGEARQLGGGAVWMQAAFDAELGLIYVGTGNAVPVLGGEVRAGNNLYMTSVVALEVSSGKLKWYRQLTHHDLWEMDLSTPLILYDARVAGKSRKAVAVMRTDGYLFVFDRATGEPLVPIQERAVPQDLRVHTAPTQPFPAGTDQIGPNCVEADMLPPGFVSGCYFEPLFYDHPEKLVNYITVRQAPMSFDPQTGYFYVAGGISPWWYRRPENPFITQATHPPGAKEYGLVAAIDSRTHKIAWQARSPWMLDAGSGIMTTAGGLMFRMEGDGNFLAFDAKTGKQLWKFQTGYVAGPTVLSLTGGAPSAAYEVDGQEYIVVGMGKGLWAFSLHGSVSEHPAPPVPPTKYGFQGIVQPLDSGGEIGMSMLRLGAGPQGQEHYVDHSGFNPVRARIAAGQPVKFTNYGVTTRTVVSADGSWTTGPVAPGQSVSVTIDKPGKYRYFATESPWSRGELLVQ